jgi:hypothetical protein
MKKFQVGPNTVYLKDNNTVHFKIQMLFRVVSINENNEIAMVILETGNYIALHETAAFCIHPRLPNREIKSIKRKYNNFIIKLKNLPVPRAKVKVKQSKIKLFKPNHESFKKNNKKST